MARRRRFAVRFLKAYAGFLYRNHNLLFVLWALGTLIGLAAISGNWLFYRSAYVLGALVPLCFLWARIHLRGLEVGVEGTTDRLQVGQEATMRVRLKSSSMFTKVWLEVEYQTDMPGSPPRTVVTLPAHSARNWKVSLPCRRRGVYWAGPVKVTTGDPFGLFRFSREYGEKQPLMVLPQPQELPYFWVPSAALPGEGTVRRRTHYVTPNAASVREYYPGDSYNRIHWRSTARLQRLMVKTFEMDPTSNVWIVLDLHQDVQAGSGDDSTEEYGVRIATSVAYRFLQTNRMLGLLAHGSQKIVLDPARGAQQYDRILEAMAVAEARGATPLAEVISEEGRRMGRHTTVVVITPSTDEAWPRALEDQIRQGTRATAVLLEPCSFGKATEEELPVGPLAACNVVSYIVRAGSDISLMLGAAGISEERMPERARAMVP